ncbi:MAG: TIGR00304 family protein [Methanobacterium sp.]|jgi:uncharacterized protein (TIGR00304 family)|nr:TIGR00304 family protein [Methanobacterium sp.]
MIKGESLVFMGIVAVIIGMLLIFLGTMFLSSGKSESNENTKVSTGGVVLIGPIPIIFGNDKGMVTIAIVAAIVIMIISYLLFYQRII